MRITTPIRTPTPTVSLEESSPVNIRVIGEGGLQLRIVVLETEPTQGTSWI